MPTVKKTTTKSRSAKDGKFVDAATAKRNPDTTVTERSKPALPAIGMPYAGGTFAGCFYDGGKPYALILAPKATGEKASVKWGAEKKIVTGALSYSDGPANTDAMAKAGSALGKWARGLKLGGHKDWYLPSRVESLVLFGELRGLKAFNEDQPDGIAQAWYWTSTQYAGTEGYAWYQTFYDGNQGNGHKDDELRARAVRRVAI
jgi:hypothetical protein